MISPQALIGLLVDNRYHLAQLCGTGSFGWVYAADELAFGQVISQVAVKLLRPLDDAARNAIIQEVLAMRQLSHQNLLTCFSAGQLSDGLAAGCLYIATELASGTLEDRLKRPSPMSVDEVREMALHIASALEYLCRRGVVHRDVKPSNILRIGSLWKLGDFGLARGFAGTSIQVSARKGTVLYMSPEAMNGKTGPFVDVWALGVVIQECLTGVLPYTGSSDVEVIAATLTQEPKIAADLPEPFLTIVRGCLTKDYHARWTATDVLQALQPAPAATHNTPQASVQSPSPANHQAPSGAQQEPRQSARARPPEPVQLHFRPEEASAVKSVAFSPDGRRVLTGNGDATARLWDLETGQQVRAFRGHTYSVNSVAFSPDGCSVLTGGSDSTAQLWDIENGRRLCTFRGHAESVLSVAFSPDGRSVLTGSSDRTARLWEARTGGEIRSLVGYQYYVPAVAFSPDGRRVVTGAGRGMFGVEGLARMWDVATGRQIQTFACPDSAIGGVAFSPDGRWVLTGSTDKTARLWDPETGHEILRFAGHTDAIGCVAFSPDGRWVLTGSSDRSARLWDAETGQEIRRFEGHTGAVTSVAFSPGGRWVATGCADRIARLWDLQTGAWLCSLLSFADGSWAVVGPENRYDAPHNGRIAHMYWAAGGQEIPLAAYRDHFYHPGLLARILGFSNEPLRPV